MTAPTAGLGLVLPSTSAASTTARRIAAVSAGVAMPSPLLSRRSGLTERTASGRGARGRVRPLARFLPSGLSPSVPEFHRVHRPLDVVGSRTVTAGSDLHRSRSALGVHFDCRTYDGSGRAV